MRHCVNETVEVFESTGPDLPALLREVADFAETCDDVNFINVDINYQCDSYEYLVTVYVH